MAEGERGTLRKVQSLAVWGSPVPLLTSPHLSHFLHAPPGFCQRKKEGLCDPQLPQVERKQWSDGVQGP